jgi:hypothetical protein
MIGVKIVRKSHPHTSKQIANRALTRAQDRSQQQQPGRNNAAAIMKNAPKRRY